MSITVNPEIFTKQGAKLAERFITINQKGNFLFSSGFVHEEDLRQYTHCILGYDRHAKAICFKFTKSADAPGAITLTHRDTGNDSVQSRSFFNFYKISSGPVIVA